MWLTEMDLQLTNIEHFSECDVQAKIKQLRVRTLRVRVRECACEFVHLCVFYIYVQSSPDISFTSKLDPICSTDSRGGKNFCG